MIKDDDMNLTQHWGMLRGDVSSPIFPIGGGALIAGQQETVHGYT
jgi:hypothetical protein